MKLSTLLLVVAFVLFASAALVGWTSDDTPADVLRDCLTLSAAGAAVYVASHLAGGNQ